MKTLYISISSSSVSKSKELSEIAAKLSRRLRNRGVEVTATNQNRIKFKPNSLSAKDVDFLVNEYDYSYAKFRGVDKFPTPLFSSNGKDLEYYLMTLKDEFVEGEAKGNTVSIRINASSGEIFVTEYK